MTTGGGEIERRESRWTITIEILRADPLGGTLAAVLPTKNHVMTSKYAGVHALMN